MIPAKAPRLSRQKKYGFRDLKLIQDLIRQNSSDQRSKPANDLSFALRFYNLRQTSVTNAPLGAALDQIFTNIVSNNGEIALNRLQKLEATTPHTVGLFCS